MSNSRRRNRPDDECYEDKGLIWKLPALKTKQLGKLGPSFGLGAGCGLGFGIGLVGGAGIGPGIPGLQVGFGLGAGCGVGLGFGYGMGKGVAYDETRKYSNVGSFFNERGTLPTQINSNHGLPKEISMEAFKFKILEYYIAFLLVYEIMKGEESLKSCRSSLIIKGRRLVL